MTVDTAVICSSHLEFISIFSFLTKNLQMLCLQHSYIDQVSFSPSNFVFTGSCLNSSQIKSIFLFPHSPLPHLANYLAKNTIQREEITWTVATVASFWTSVTQDWVEYFHKYLPILICFYKNVQLFAKYSQEGLWLEHRFTEEALEVEVSMETNFTADVQIFFSHPNQREKTGL